MARTGGGRPRGGVNAGTRQVRLMADLAEMISAIVDLGVIAPNSAQYLDPFIRAAVTADFERLRPQIEKVRQADEVRRLARHKHVKTTLDYYASTDLKRLGAAADRLPPPPPA